MGLGTATRHGPVIGGSRGRHMYSLVWQEEVSASGEGQECVPYTYPLPGEPAPDRGAGGTGLQGPWVQLCTLVQDRVLYPRTPEKKMQSWRSALHQSSASFHPVEIATFLLWSPFPLSLRMGADTPWWWGVLRRLLTLAATQLRLGALLLLLIIIFFFQLFF